MAGERDAKRMADAQKPRVGGSIFEMLEPEVFELDDDTVIFSVISDGLLSQSLTDVAMDCCQGQVISMVNVDRCQLICLLVKRRDGESYIAGSEGTAATLSLCRATTSVSDWYVKRCASFEAVRPRLPHICRNQAAEGTSNHCCGLDIAPLCGSCLQEEGQPNEASLTTPGGWDPKKFDRT